MKIALLGDVAFFGKYSIVNNSQVFEYFKDTKSMLGKYDYVVANLETPFASGKEKYGYKSAYLFSEIQNIALLKYLGISVVNLANNHIFDFGNKSYELTKQILDDNGIYYFGVEHKQVSVERDENKIVFCGYCCYSTNPSGLNANGVNELNYADIEKALIENSEKNFNNVLSIHAGQEHINYPDYDHIKFARKLAQVIPYVFYGHHPHVLQGIETCNNSLIAYSLGNFCFDDVYGINKSGKPIVRQGANNKSSIILELEYQNNKLVGYKPISIYAGADKMKIGPQEINKKLDSYSLKLNMVETDYNRMRDELLSSFVRDKNAQRDLKWYLSRLNLRTISVIRDLYTNKRKYNAGLKRYL
jgi:poly-gamma-glutamate synthesis protein (capsule biosynthesis protein)